MKIVTVATDGRYVIGYVDGIASQWEVGKEEGEAWACRTGTEFRSDEGTYRLSDERGYNFLPTEEDRWECTGDNPDYWIPAETGGEK